MGLYKGGELHIRWQAAGRSKRKVPVQRCQCSGAQYFGTLTHSLGAAAERSQQPGPLQPPSSPLARPHKMKIHVSIQQQRQAGACQHANVSLAASSSVFAAGRVAATAPTPAGRREGPGRPMCAKSPPSSCSAAQANMLQACNTCGRDPLHQHQHQRGRIRSLAARGPLLLSCCMCSSQDGRHLVRCSFNSQQAWSACGAAASEIWGKCSLLLHHSCCSAWLRYFASLAARCWTRPLQAGHTECATLPSWAQSATRCQTAPPCHYFCNCFVPGARGLRPWLQRHAGGMQAG